jgi:NADH:quinone reductase (non-electrogenic)
VLRRERNLECEMARAVDVDADRRVVICRRPLGAQFEVGYDHLIVAAGVEQSYFGHDEFRTLAPGMKTIEDALTIRRRVFGAFEMAETAASSAERAMWLTFALVGAGPTGVELAGQIREVATKTLREAYRRADPKDARVLLFDGGTAPLASFGEKLSGRTAETLRTRRRAADLVACVHSRRAAGARVHRGPGRADAHCLRPGGRAGPAGA